MEKVQVTHELGSALRGFERLGRPSYAGTVSGELGAQVPSPLATFAVPVQMLSDAPGVQAVGTIQSTQLALGALVTGAALLVVEAHGVYAPSVRLMRPELATLGHVPRLATEAVPSAPDTTADLGTLQLGEPLRELDHLPLRLIEPRVRVGGPNLSLGPVGEDILDAIRLQLEGA